MAGILFETKFLLLIKTGMLPGHILLLKDDCS